MFAIRCRMPSLSYLKCVDFRRSEWGGFSRNIRIQLLMTADRRIYSYIHFLSLSIFSSRYNESSMLFCPRCVGSLSLLWYVWTGNVNHHLVFLFAVESLQSGYTCETSVTLTCPEATKLLIIEVSYSSECPTIDQINEGGALYSPSHCLGYDRERTASLCNGKRTCTIDHSLALRPQFNVGKQANCAFKGQSINVEYSCVPGMLLSTSWWFHQ